MQTNLESQSTTITPVRFHQLQPVGGPPAPLAPITLLTAGRLPPGQGDFRAMLICAFDGMIDLFRAERGLLSLENPEGERFEMARSFLRYSFSSDELESVRPWIHAPGSHPSHAPCFIDRGLDSRGQERSALRVPLRGVEGWRGVLYLDRRGHSFPRDLLWPLEWFARMVEVEVGRGFERHWRWRCLDISHRLRSQAA